jgi:hypothetical protein
MTHVAVLVLACCACRMSDADAPIGIVVVDLSAADAADLAEAARCWNLELGTQLVMGTADQQVEAFYDDYTCTFGAAQVQAGWPMRLAVCPQRYLTDEAKRLRMPFRVLSHELGHVLNIIDHPSDPLAVMRGGGHALEEMFRPVDRDLFFAANPDFVGVEPCAGTVIRKPNYGGERNTEYCVCRD